MLSSVEHEKRLQLQCHVPVVTYSVGPDQMSHDNFSNIKYIMPISEGILHTQILRFYDNQKYWKTILADYGDFWPICIITWRLPLFLCLIR